MCTHTHTQVLRSLVPLCLPDDLLGEAAVDGVDVLLQRRARLGLDLLHLLQAPAGHEEAPGSTVMRQYLRREEGRTEWSAVAAITFGKSSTSDTRHSLY